MDQLCRTQALGVGKFTFTLVGSVEHSDSYLANVDTGKSSLVHFRSSPYWLKGEAIHMA